MSESLRAIPMRWGRHGAAIARLAADWLGLAAAPIFTTMALLTATFGRIEPLCSAHGSLMTGMIPMYLLMGALHLRPWLGLIAGQRVSLPDPPCP